MPRGKSAKSERTRAGIEASARHLFAQQGYERTTIREIAAAAGADPALVIRYFGSKDELFAAVTRPELHLPELGGIPRELHGQRLVAHFLDIWEGDGGLPVLLRSAASNPAAAQRLRETFAGQVAPMIAVLGTPGTAALRAGLVASQLLGLALTRYVLQLPPVVAIPRDKVIAEVGATIQRYLYLE
jgi:AcrR family transcriptional regulator